MRKVILIQPVLFAALCCCVYFNTFYNAEQGFKRAEKNQKEAEINRLKQDKTRTSRAGLPLEPGVSMNDKNLYKEAIDRANKVITFSPNSKYIDDALWLIGKARYNMGEYISSDKRMRELVTNFPNSKFGDGAYYYIGMSQFWLKRYDIALEAFGHIADKKKGSYKDDAAFMIAYMDFIQGNYQSSRVSFEGFIKNFGGSDSTSSAQFFAGACYDSLKQYPDALKAYLAVLKYKPSFDMEFDTRFAAGLAAFKADSLPQGMKIFEDLAKQPRFFDRSSQIRLRLAEGKQLSGKTDEAIKEYDKIIVEYPSTNEAAEANYRLGLLYENLNDFDKAKDNYNKASQGSQDVRIRNLATTHSAQLAKLESYRKKLIKNPISPALDSAAVAKSDSLAKPDTLVSADSVAEASLSMSPSGMPVLDTITSTKTDSLPEPDTLAKADTLIKTMPAPTSSGIHAGSESLIVKDVPIGPMPNILPESLTIQEVIRRQLAEDSLAGLAMPGAAPGISAKGDSLALLSPTLADMSGIIDTTSKDTTGQSTGAADTITTEDDASVRFLLAELYHHEMNRPDSALNEYLLLAEHYPQSAYAPKALLAGAFIYESKGDTAAAKSLYNRIVASYPLTAQAKYAASHADSSVIPTDIDVFTLYNLAEDLYFKDNNPDSAAALFAYIETTYPTTEYSAKSAYARAWILDQTLRSDGDSSAYFAFQDVLNKYPETPYAQQAKIKLGLVKDTTATTAANDSQMTTQQDSPLQDSLAGSISDTIGGVAFDLPVAPPVKDTGNFLFPGSLLNKKLKGRVTFKIKIDPFGRISDYQILGPSGEQAIDSAAILALQSTTFDVSGITDLSRLNDYFRYDIKFATPRLDEFYNPYKVREERGP